MESSQPAAAPSEAVPSQAPDEPTASGLPRPPGTQAPRKRRQLDWELVSCGFQGHRLVGTDAERLRPQDYLLARDEGSFRFYRCLRCDSWVALAPPESPGRAHPPDRGEIVVPLRGKALHDRVVLRLIAVDRVLHFVILVRSASPCSLFAADRANLHDRFYQSRRPPARRSPAGRFRPPGTSASCTISTGCSRCSRDADRGRDRAARLRGAGGRRGDRACGTASAGPST